MKKVLGLIFFVIFIVFFVKSIVGIYHVWIRPEPPSEMIQGMSNQVDGDSLVISFEPISNDSIKLSYSIDSTGVIDTIFVNLSYYRIFCSDSTVSFEIIYK